MRQFYFPFISGLFFILFPLFGSAQTAVIEGKITYHYQWGMKNTIVYLVDMQTGQKLDSTVADNQGFYIFNVAAGSYHISLKPTLASGGVDLADVLNIIYHLSPSIQVPLDTVERVAADVDGDDSVSMVDAYTILTYWAAQAGYGTPFDFAVGEWVSTADIAPDTIVIDSTNINDTINYEIGTSSAGDVNGNWIPKKKPSAPLLAATSKLIQGSVGQQVQIPVTFTCNLVAGAAGLILEYPDAYLEINSVTSPHTGLFHVVSGNKIYLIWINFDGTANEAWQDDLLITVNATIKPTIPLNKVISFEVDPMSEILDSDGKRIEKPVIELPGIQVADNETIIRNVYPSPLSGEGTIELYLPESEKAILQIIDMQGKIMDILFEGVLQAGNSNINFTTGTLSPGIYILDISVENRPNESYRLMVK